MKKIKIAIVSSSKRAESKSRVLAKFIGELLVQRSIEVQLIDLLDTKLPDFNQDSYHLDKDFQMVKAAIAGSDGLVLCSPIYNWSISAELKKCIEITGAFDKMGNKGAWYDKIVTFACVGGINQSYMSWGHTALSLMMDFKCIINPFSIYGLEEYFSESKINSDELVQRVERSMGVKIDLIQNLQNRSYISTWEV